MNYLYGDSTKSTLKANFLEFLRDAIDFCVFALEVDRRIGLEHDHVEALERKAADETDALETFVETVTLAIAEAPTGEPDSPAALCAARLTTLSEEAHASFLDALRAKLAADIAEAQAREAAERAACRKALEALLVPHDPPEATTRIDLALDSAGAYTAQSEGEATFGLAWRFDFTIPAGHLWSAPVRVERVMPQLEIRAPQLSGWISKEVKTKPQRLERHVVIELSDDGETLAFKLRAEVGSGNGFDVEVNAATGEVESIARVVEDPKDTAAGAFELDEDGTKKLLELATKLRASTAGLEGKRLAAATVDDEEFETLAAFTVVVNRLIDMMAPITREITNRSLTPTELILRRMLGDDRREEIFVTKASLREKYAALSEAQRACFAPLGLDTTSRTPQKEVPQPEPSVPTTRQELPHSQPPPPPTEVIAPPSSAASNPDDGRKGGKEEVVAELKKIISLIRQGKIEEGYRGFRAFFSSDAFGGFRGEDKRQALGVMVLGKTPSPATEAVIDAHLAAIHQLQSLAEASNHPLDYEMLGLCHQVIEDGETAAKMFAKALELERERNPQSELCGRLMKRVSAL